MAQPTGLAIPVGVNPDGRARLSTDDEQLVKIIGLHLSIADSENPFQRIGIDGVVFEVNDTRIRPLIRYRLELLFGRLKGERRAKLDENSIKFTSTEDTGELELFFRYWNLKTNRLQDFTGAIDMTSGRVIPL